MLLRLVKCFKYKTKIPDRVFAEVMEGLVTLDQITERISFFLVFYNFRNRKYSAAPLDGR